MPSRYIISTTPEAIESKFAIPTQSIMVENNYNISPGQLAPVITNEKPYEIQLFKFGLTPFWAKSEMNLFNDAQFGGSGKYRKTQLGTILYFSSEDELRKLFSLYFKIIEIKTFEIYGKTVPHIVTYAIMEK